MKHKVEHLLQAFINSYAQLFFADHKVFAWLLLLSSYVNPITGLSGSLAAILAIIFSWWIGLDRDQIKFGTYSYNALMTGLVLGSLYNFTAGYWLVILCASVLSVLLSVLFFNILAKYKLPALSLGFLFTLWIITLAVRGFANIEHTTSGLFRLNEWYSLGGTSLIEWMTLVEQQLLPDFATVYLKSISAVFFQYNIISGVLIALGLFIWSRIGFLLSVVGYTIGYLFFFSVSGEFTQLYYTYIGFNFILTAIAIGGFYVIPSTSSFVLAIIAMPIIGTLITAFNNLVGIWQLPLYSLPFVTTVLLILLLLSNRVVVNKLVPVTIQLFSPEKNLYHYTNQLQRFKNNKLINIQLPFFGEWLVSQGYNGNITHKNEWQHALDFVVADETKHTFKLPGKSKTDFYCYSLPVLCPASGYVVAIVDGINDNEIGEVDIKQNWGNVVIIKHTEGFYSKLTHLKKESITVRVNDYVNQGAIIGYCGSSGRSPEPHLHFQNQLTPYIGSQTFPYPIAYFITRENKTYTYNEFSTPVQGSFVHQPIKTPLLVQSLNFIPGQKLKFEVNHKQAINNIVVFECMVDSHNHTYLYCPKTNAMAYFVNNGTVFYFTRYVGNKKSYLYYFYLAFHKILLGYYQNMVLTDTMPVTTFRHLPFLVLHDLVAPFMQFIQVKFQSQFSYLDNELQPKHIIINTNVSSNKLKQKSNLLSCTLHFKNNSIHSWQVVDNKNNLLNFKWICE